MKKVGVAILGLGVVGGGTYRILTEHREFYKESYGLDINVECVLELRKERATQLGIEESRVASNIAEICSNPDVDIVVEVMGGVEPAKTFVLAALNAGKSVVTSNKEMYCKYSYELEKAAKRSNVGLYYEATCVGGVPIIRALCDNLQGNVITSIVGIVNGTTNYILSNMTENGISYEEALKKAQELGFAEANPSADVEGYDATYKLSILASLAFHQKIPYTEIYREGIENVEPEDIKYGKRFGYVLKLLAIGKCDGNNVEARVHPAFVKESHPLADVRDSYNAVYVVGDSVQDVMLYGRGAGAEPTGSAIVGDIIYCASRSVHRYSPFENTEEASPATKFVRNFESAYYLRLEAEEKPGVLSKITSVLGKNGISVDRIVQEGPDARGKIPVIVMTHTTHENNIVKAVNDINSAGDYASVSTYIRVYS